MLEQALISGLAVACVETVLEHGRLNIVAFVLFFCGKQRPEQLLLYHGGHEAIKLVVPGIRVEILLGDTVVQLHITGAVKKSK